MIKKFILIINDERPQTEAVKVKLEATGDFEVKSENQSIRAMTTGRELKPSIILPDYIMPGSDEGDVSGRFRNDALLDKVPIIMLTALTSNEETGEQGSTHRNGHLMIARPIRMKKLIACIEEQLAAAHTQL